MNTFEAAVELVKAGLMSGQLGKPIHPAEPQSGPTFPELAAHWGRMVSWTKAELDKIEAQTAEE